MPLALSVLLAFLLAPVVDRLERLSGNRFVAVALTTVVDLRARRRAALRRVQPVPRPGAGPAVRTATTCSRRSGACRSGGRRPRAERRDGQGADRGVAEKRAGQPRFARRRQGADRRAAAERACRWCAACSARWSRRRPPRRIVIVFVIFMLLQREDLRDRLVRLLGTQRDAHHGAGARRCGRARQPLPADADADQRRARGGWWRRGSTCIGVPDAMLWGALTIVLRFIPYLGPAAGRGRADRAVDRRSSTAGPSRC